MTCVGASVRVLPSIFPFRTKARPAEVVVIATLDSTPSFCQNVRRRWSRTHSLTWLGDAFERLTRPAPMGLCRQAAVGPVVQTRAALAAAPARGIQRARRDASFSRRKTATDARASAASRRVTKIHVPVAERRGRRPNPPASEPRIAPAVFQA